MKNLLKFEIRKLKQTKSIYICLVIAMLMLGLNTYLAAQFQDSMTVQESMKGYVSSSMLIMILGIIVPLVVCEDYTNHTLKNIIARGFSRIQVILCKYAMVVVICLLYNFVIAILSYLLGSFFFQSGNSPDYFISSMIVQILLSLAYATIFFVVSILNTHLGVSIAINIIGPAFLSLGLSMIDLFVNINDFQFSALHLDTFIESMSQINVVSKDIVQAVCASLVYICISLFIGIMCFKRKEIK